MSENSGGIWPRTPRQLVWAQTALIALVLCAVAASELFTLPARIWEGAGALETFKSRASERWLRQTPDREVRPAPLLSFDEIDAILEERGARD